MCGPGLALCFLLWIGGVSTTQGEVIAPASLTAEAGRPLVLACNITTATGSEVLQVRWLDQNAKLLLAYEQREPVRISHQASGVRLTASHGDTSAITIENVRADGGGCYRCVFDVFPQGTQEGSTCISVTGKVHLEGNRTAVSGKPLTLSCSYSLPERVRQVLWRKTAEQGDTVTVASYAKHGHYSVEEEFRGRVHLSRTLGDTQLSIQVVRTEDEACYTCEFHTYPDGARSATACLSVYVLPEPEVSHVTSPSGVTEAKCTAQSRPAADITWDVRGDNRTLGPPVLSVSDQGDGTTIMTSTLMFPSALLSDVAVRCIVQHQGLDKPVTLFLNTNVAPVTVILLSVCGVAAVLLLCLCVCLCKCFICTND
ncbi:nectin-2 [Salarias fasciatus]|uniref:Nectin-2-like n=1 Tax=Salarias fasciatus TaxID=181472 RepID=A0A672G2B3_SALFA|nr:nectin-2-like [Salarias fasciatus]